MTLLVTRSGEDGKALADILRGQGHDVLMDAMLDIAYDLSAPIDLTAVQAILATSANGVRAFCKASVDRALPVFAVGDATARTAREGGFKTVHSAGGDVDSLARLVTGELDPGAGALFHPAGSKVAGDLAGMLQQKGYHYKRQVLYHARKSTALKPVTVAHLKAGDIKGVLFFSPRTATAFVDLLRAAKLEKTCHSVTAYCLSRAVAGEAGKIQWSGIEICSGPNQKAMLELLNRRG